MKKENKDNMAQEISITIKTTEEMADAIGKLSFDSDRLDFNEFNSKTK